MNQSNSLAAIAIMSLGMLFIPVGDTAGKLLTETHSVAPVFVAWSRFVLGAVMVFMVFAGRGFDLAILSDWRIWFRGGLITGGIVCILTALRTEPIANVFAAFFIGPIISYFGSAFLLGEGISRARTFLLFMGFCGVLMVVKPGLDVSPGIVWALIAGCFYGSFLVASKWLSMLAKPRMLLLSHLIIGAVLLTPFAATEIPQIDRSIGVLVLISAAGSALGNLLLIVANRMADANRLAPLVYVQLVSATILGILVFGNVPDPVSIAGLGLLLISGFVSFFLVNRVRLGA